MKKYLNRGAVLFLLLLLISGCSKGTSEAPENTDNKKPVPVETALCEIGTLGLEKTLSGKIAAEEDIPVIPTTPSKVLEVLVKQGDHVDEGDLLFVTDSKDINNQYVPAKNAYDRTKAVTEEALKLARQNLDNTKRLFEAGAVAKIQLEQEELALKQQEAQLLTQLDQLKAALDTARDALSDTAMLSPATGVISSVSIIEGATAPVGQAALYVSRVGTVNAQLDVSENILPFIRVGQEVSVTLSSGTEAFTGTVESVSPTADRITHLYSVKVTLDNTAGKFVPGMFVSVVLPGQTHEKAILVPAEAVLTEGDKRLVYIVENNKAKRVEVTIGLSDGTKTELLSGLTGGETVIVKGQDYVSDGGDINVTKGGSEE